MLPFSRPGEPFKKIGLPTEDPLFEPRCAKCSRHRCKELQSKIDTPAAAHRKKPIGGLPWVARAFLSSSNEKIARDSKFRRDAGPKTESRVVAPHI